MRNPIGNQSGMALIVTLCILAALVIMAAGLGVMVRTESQISRNYTDMIRCRWAARAGIESAVNEVKDLSGKSATYLGEDGYRKTSDDQGIDLNGASFEITIEDEAAKANVNAAPSAVLRALFQSQEIADCIVDWRDQDSTPQPQGAEADYYAGLPDPYRPRNAAMETVGELLLVKGVSSDLLDHPVTEGGAKPADIVTVYSTDNNAAVDGKDRVNVNTADRNTLKTRLGDVLQDREIGRIITQRGRRKFNSAADLLGARGVSRDKLRRIYDRITTSNDKTVAGLINVNTATVDVLALLPGLDDGTASRIVAYRAANGAFADVGQILSVSELRDDGFRKAAGYLTVRSHIFKITSTGHLAGEETSARITCVVQSDDGKTARIRYWQE